MMSLTVIIMAAGKGTRMKSRLPKVLQPLAGKPLLAHVLAQANALQANKIITVYGHGGEQVKATFANQPIDWVEQAEQKGTGHAILVTLPVLPTTGYSLILSGDVPLIQKDTLERLHDAAQNGIAMLTMSVENPFGLGRIVRNANSNILKIVEQKDASPEQLAINEINAGVYCVRNDLLHRWLPKLDNNNAQGEYYLTDIVAMAVADGISIGSTSPSLAFEVEGVNDRAQLANLERRFQLYQAQQLMQAGVMLLDPNRFDLRGSLTCGMDVCIDANVVIEGDCTFADGVQIGAGCIIKNSTLATGVVLSPYSVLDNVSIGEAATIGPFARLRPGCVLEKDVHIGNFVEVKNSHMLAGAKAGHLSYLGDAQIGTDTNIGAGTITCNYDGANKHKTTIGNNVFIGSNSALVAPIHIDDGATVGAGSVITKMVEAGNLAVARGLQRNIENYQRPVKNKAP